MNVKQVIVIRRDLKTRRGKEIAQGAHASMAFLSEAIAAHKEEVESAAVLSMDYQPEFLNRLSEEALEWLSGLFTKVTCQVDSLEDLQIVEKAAKSAGLECHMIVDSGKTEFAGIPTATALAIGPGDAEKIDAVTGELRLY